MSTTHLHQPGAAREREGRRPSRRRHAWFAAAAASLALLVVPAIADAAVEGWGSSSAVGLGGEQFPVVTPTLIPEGQDATAAALGGEVSYLLTPNGVLSSAGGTFTLIPGTAGAKAVATGSSTLIVEADGTVDGFGENTYGEAGGTPGVPVETPTPIAGLSDVTSVGVSLVDSVALEADGTVWNWGNHEYLGSTAAAAGPDTATPTQVTLPADDPATAIAVGGRHVLALLQDGSVWAWGYNGNGQVGDGSTVPVTVPVQVIPPAAPGDPTVTAVSAGLQSSFALYSDGTYKAWGSDTSGQLGLGLGSPTNEAPVTVPTSPDPAAVAVHPDAYPPLQQIVSTRSTTYGIVSGTGQVMVWGVDGGAFGFAENPPSYTYAWPYDPANPDTPGAAEQGATEIPQRLGRLKEVPWLGVGPTASGFEIAATTSIIRFLSFASAPAFFSHPVGTVSLPQLDYLEVEEPTEVTSIQITGADADDFSIVGTNVVEGFIEPKAGTFLPLPATVSSGGAGVLVRFNPSGLGDRIATLKVFGRNETASIQLTGFGTELPGNTQGPQGPAGVGLAGPPGTNGTNGKDGTNGPPGPAGKNGVVVFASSRSTVSAKRGSTASLGFLLVNGTTAKLAGATVAASVPKSLGVPATPGPSRVASLAAGGSRQLRVPVTIGAHAKLGTQRVKVAFTAGDKTVTRTVSVRVTG